MFLHPLNVNRGAISAEVTLHCCFNVLKMKTQASYQSSDASYQSSDAVDYQKISSQSYYNCWPIGGTADCLFVGLNWLE
jgi:hypothetical protein